MIIEEKNKYQEERDEEKKIFEMLKDVRLPEGFMFVDFLNGIQIRYRKWLKLIDSGIADISLNKDDSLTIRFVDEGELNRLRNCFIYSKTKFRLEVGDNYY